MCWWRSRPVSIKCCSKRVDQCVHLTIKYSEKELQLQMIHWAIINWTNIPSFNTHATIQRLVKIMIILLSTSVSFQPLLYSDVITSATASQITCVSIVYSTVCSGADQIKHHSSASLAFVRGIHRRPVNSPHKGPVTRKMFPFDDVIMACLVADLSWRPYRYLSLNFSRSFSCN